MLLCLYPFPHPVRRPLLPLKAEALRTFLASLQFKRRQALNITQGESGKQWLLLLFFFRLQFLIKLVCSRFEVTILKAKKFTIFSPPPLSALLFLLLDSAAFSCSLHPADGILSR